MELQTRGIFAIALLPPGPQEREVNRLASRIYARTAEPSCLACPGFVLLAAGRAGQNRPGVTELEGLWARARGAFSSGPLLFEGACLYLALGGPLEALAEGAGQSFGERAALPILPGRGFFLGRFAASLSSRLIGELESLAPPPFSFASARLALLELEGDFESFRFLSWREEALAYRKRPHARQKGEGA